MPFIYPDFICGKCLIEDPPIAIFKPCTNILIFPDWDRAGTEYGKWTEMNKPRENQQNRSPYSLKEALKNALLYKERAEVLSKKTTAAGTEREFLIKKADIIDLLKDKMELNSDYLMGLLGEDIAPGRFSTWNEPLSNEMKRNEISPNSDLLPGLVTSEKIPVQVSSDHDTARSPWQMQVTSEPSVSAADLLKPTTQDSQLFANAIEKIDIANKNAFSGENLNQHFLSSLVFSSDRSKSTKSAAEKEVTHIFRCIPGRFSIEGGSDFALTYTKGRAFDDEGYIAQFHDEDGGGTSNATRNKHDDKLLDGEKIPRTNVYKTREVVGRVVRRETLEQLGTFSFVYECNDVLKGRKLVLDAGERPSKRKMPFNRQPCMGHSDNRDGMFSSSTSGDNGSANQRFLSFLLFQAAESGAFLIFDALVTLPLGAKVLKCFDRCHPTLEEIAREHGHDDLADEIKEFMGMTEHDDSFNLLEVSIQYEDVRHALTRLKDECVKSNGYESDHVHVHRCQEKFNDVAISDPAKSDRDNLASIEKKNYSNSKSVENDTETVVLANGPTSCGMDNHEVYREKATDSPPRCTGDGDVDHENVIVEDSPFNGPCDGDVDSEKTTVEDLPPNGRSDFGVDRKKATVEGPPPNGTGGLDVDREKATVEVPPYNGKSDVSVDLENVTVEKPPSSCTGNVDVDQENATVEEPPLNGRSDGGVDRENATVEDPSPRGTGGLDIGQEKATVKDSPLSSTPDGKVDREKATAEGSPPSDKSDDVVNFDNARAKQSGSYLHTCGVNCVQEPAQRLYGQCNIVDEGTSTVEDEPVSKEKTENGQKWIVRFHFGGSAALGKFIRTKSLLCEWNRPIIFGRGKDVNIFLNDERASRRHLELIGEILPDAQVYFTVRNLSCSNGFFVNNQYITSNDKMITLHSGYTLSVAQLYFNVEVIPGHDIQNFKLEIVQSPPRIHVNVGAELRGDMLMSPSAFRCHVPVDDLRSWAKCEVMPEQEFGRVPLNPEKGRNLTAEELRAPKHRTETEYILPLVITHNSGNPRIVGKVKGNLKFPSNNAEMKAILDKTQIIVCRRQPRNLKHILSKAEFSSENISPTASKCTEPRCGKYDLIITGNTLELKVWNIKSCVNCKSKDIVYTIICSKCKESYVDQTQNLRNRVTLYRQQIKHKQYRHLSVSKHLTNCSDGKLKIMPILQWRNNKLERGCKEKQIISKRRPKLNSDS